MAFGSTPDNYAHESLLWWCLAASVAAHALLLTLVPGWRAGKETPPMPLTVELREPPPEVVPPKPLPVESRPVVKERLKPVPIKPEPVKPNEVNQYNIDLHAINHVFKKGHRIMVQVQSTWFPVIDRNPQRFVPNIFLAKESDFQRATQRVFRSGQHASYIAMPVVESPRQ